MSINNLTGTWKREKSRRNSQINETRDFPRAEGQAPRIKEHILWHAGNVLKPKRILKS